MTAKTQYFDFQGDLTFVLQGYKKKDARRGSSLLGYKSSSRERVEQIPICVSSKRVMAASPVFGAMLKYSFLEGTTLRKTGKVEIPLPDDDPDCFALLMSIIHNRSQHGRLPPNFDLNMLTTLAILVDKYRLQITMAEASESWIYALRGTIPQTFGPGLMQWLCISWVFRRPAEFNHVTRIAERESNGMDLDSYSTELREELPIPERVIEAIYRRRTTAISRCFEILAKYIDILQCGTPRCTSTRHEPHRFTCDAVLLGSLLESSSRLGVWPPPEAPFLGLTFMDITAEINQIKIVSFCAKNGYTNQSSSSHGVKAEISSALAKVKTRRSGLSLKDFD